MQSHVARYIIPMRGSYVSSLRLGQSFQCIDRSMKLVKQNDADLFLTGPDRHIRLVSKAPSQRRSYQLPTFLNNDTIHTEYSWERLYHDFRNFFSHSFKLLNCSDCLEILNGSKPLRTIGCAGSVTNEEATIGLHLTLQKRRCLSLLLNTIQSLQRHGEFFASIQGASEHCSQKVSSVPAWIPSRYSRPSRPQAGSRFRSRPHSSPSSETRETSINLFARCTTKSLV